jgi:carbon storage regulator
VGETLMIGAEVTVTVIKGNQVRIGINAPKEVEVHQEEIYDPVPAERRSSQSSGILFRGLDHLIGGALELTNPGTVRYCVRSRARRRRM